MIKTDKSQFYHKSNPEASLGIFDFSKTPPELASVQGTKEEDGKLNYELDWEFVKNMAERMAMNKGKYEPYNWQKPLNIKKLINANTRHFMEIQLGQYSDEQLYGHFIALACNSMMIVYQLKHYHDTTRINTQISENIQED